MGGELQGIRINKINLSGYVIKQLKLTYFPRLELCELPEDLFQKVRKLTVGCMFWQELLEWLGDFVHLETLHLQCYSSQMIGCNCTLTELPISLGQPAAEDTFVIGICNTWEVTGFHRKDDDTVAPAYNVVWCTARFAFIIWLWANRPSSKGSKLLFPFIKAKNIKSEMENLRLLWSLFMYH